MKKELLKYINQHESLITSVYVYTLWGNEIPVLVVSDFTAELQIWLQKISEPGWIILTQSDLDHGDDVFSVVLLHIQKNSTCEWWKDTLVDVRIAPYHLRHHLEAQIRHVMINIREAIILDKSTQDLLPWLGLQLERITCGLSFLDVEYIEFLPEEHNLVCIYKHLENRVAIVDLLDTVSWKNE